jgi:hypothetical protein
MSLETTWPRFSEGALALVWSYGDTLALAGSQRRTVTQAPLRS